MARHGMGAVLVLLLSTAPAAGCWDWARPAVLLEGDGGLDRGTSDDVLAPDFAVRAMSQLSLIARGRPTLTQIQTSHTHQMSRCPGT